MTTWTKQPSWSAISAASAIASSKRCGKKCSPTSGEVVLSELLSAALAYAHRGWRVFPLHGITDGACSCGNPECSSPGKHPRVRRGLYEGTTDPKKIESWWRRWPTANIGIVTGPDSGLLVIDIDLPKAKPSLDRLEQVSKRLPDTLTARTGGGGLHLYFRHPDRTLPNTTGRLPGFDEALEGIDVRAHGGYVVAPPSLHISSGKYLWIGANQPIADLPDWIKEPERPSTSLAAAGKADYEGDGSAYGLAVLSGELDQLRTATPGTRNHALNRAAFAVGQVVAGGELEERHARHELLSTALAIGLPEPEARQTLDSGFTSGAREPRSAPHRLS